MGLHAIAPRFSLSEPAFAYTLSRRYSTLPRTGSGNRTGLPLISALSPYISRMSRLRLTNEYRREYFLDISPRLLRLRQVFERGLITAPAVALPRRQSRLVVFQIDARIAQLALRVMKVLLQGSAVRYLGRGPCRQGKGSTGGRCPSGRGSAASRSSERPYGRRTLGNPEALWTAY